MLKVSVPYEACGFLLGRRAGGTFVVKQACPVTNTVGRYYGFAIADYERRRIERFSRRLELELIAVYHSHPTGIGQLSEADRRCLRFATTPWIIVYPGALTPDQKILVAAYAPPAGRSIPVEIVEEEERMSEDLASLAPPPEGCLELIKTGQV